MPKIRIEDEIMVIIQLDADEAIEIIEKLNVRGIKLYDLITETINRYFPAAHTMDKEAMAEGYKEMGIINLAIANGDQEG